MAQDPPNWTRGSKIHSKLLRVAMNTWWDDDPTQRYWMQITDRRDLDRSCDRLGEGFLR
jgi:hypothetical protein